MNENEAPPYIIPNSVWEREWKTDNEDGWDLLKYPMKAAADGDLRTLELLSQVRPGALLERDSNGWAPIHEAVHFGRLDLVKFLLKHGASANDKTGKPNEALPIEIATQLLGNDHEVTKFLWTVTKL